MNKKTLLAALLGSSILVTLPVASFADNKNSDGESQMCESKENGQECSDHKGGMGDHKGHKGDHKKSGHKEGKRGQNDGMMRIDRMAKKLDLSDEQKADVKSIMESSRDANKDMRMKMIESQKALRDLDTSSADYDAEVAVIAETIAGLEKDKIINKASIRKQVESVLTDEQKAKLAEMKGKKGMKKGMKKDKNKE